MPQTTITRTIDAPIERVFETIADINNFSKAVPHIVGVFLRAWPGPSYWVSTWKDPTALGCPNGFPLGCTGLTLTRYLRARCMGHCSAVNIPFVANQLTSSAGSFHQLPRVACVPSGNCRKLGGWS